MTKINVLGTDYDVIVQKTEDNPRLYNATGLCEIFTKKVIVAVDEVDEKDGFENIDAFYHKALRHELFHAVFQEAGHTAYMEDETLIEALAVLYPKIEEIMKQAEKFNFNKRGK